MQLSTLKSHGTCHNTLINLVLINFRGAQVDIGYCVVCCLPWLFRVVLGDLDRDQITGSSGPSEGLGRVT